ncbi:MAG: hypothetical protein IPM48_04275 [Saprospiraceae bacterium]|nr:hypothetical protein [Saprospiraceae bacterium]
MEFYCIVINWDIHHELETWLPKAIIARCSPQGELLYYDREYNQHTKDSDVHWIKNTHSDEILALCSELNPDEILLKFSKKTKAKISLKKLINDENQKSLILKYIEQKRAHFLQKCQVTNFPAVIQMERKVHLQKNQLYYGQIVPDLLLSFYKTESGLNYKLQLKFETEVMAPCKVNIIIVNNKPGWIILNKIFYPIYKLNANKLSPFFQKEVISIPRNLTRTYFEKFVSDLLTIAEIEVEGYEIIYIKDYQKAILRTNFDFIENKWMLELSFDYGLIQFNYSDLRKGKNFIRPTSEEDVEVTRVERNQKTENQKANVLQMLGLLCSGNQRFYSKEEDPLAIFQFIRQNKTLLESEFECSEFTVEGKEILFEIPSISLQNRTGADWFDVYGEISIGSHRLPFTSLVRHLKSNQRCYELSDGRIFIIPLEWFARFDQIIKFGEEHEDQIRMPKSHLERLRQAEPSFEHESLQIETKKPKGSFQLPSGLLASLRPYQLAGFEWLANHHADGLGACLADDMGLGKTLQTIAVLLHAKNEKELLSEFTVKRSGLPRDLFALDQAEEKSDFCALIVLPSSLVYNWAAELEKFAPSLKVLQHVGAMRDQKRIPFEQSDVVLTSYSIILRDYPLFQQKKFDYIILDESQQIKNKDSKTFRLLHALQSVNRISLSGTPIENSLADLWSQMEFINPKILGSFNFFNNHFIKPIKNLKDDSVLGELKQIISPYLLRRTKEQVAQDLPILTEQVFYCAMTDAQLKLYEEEKSAARNSILQIDWKNQKNQFVVLNSLLRLRQIANHPSLIKDKDWVSGSGKFDDVSSQMRVLYHSKHKTLVFSSFTSQLDLYEKWLKEEKIAFVKLTGDTPGTERQKIIQRFQEDSEILFFLISIKAGGTGLNLTAAEYVFILDPWWNPFVEKQAVARAHRIGQEKAIQVIRFITKDSIEEKIHRLQKDKLQLSGEIIEDMEMPAWLSDNLSQLFD